MKIAVEKDTNLVLYYGNLWFTSDGLRGKDFIDTRKTEENCVLIDMDYRPSYQYEIIDENNQSQTINTPEYNPPSLPMPFIGCGYTFENNEFVINQIGINYLNRISQEENEKLKNEIIKKVQERLDIFAKTREYDGILSACSYATSTIEKFSIEGQFCVQLRDNTWKKIYSIFDEIENGDRQMPISYNEIEEELPIAEWPN